ncbi:hypothetical protein PV664_33985 [Streptomyces sp. ME01-18a]|uniref:hypothetical protein n=1 Tax=Streptomyces sp. ME01-18a TaxID=3028669 RepID=UPI0029B3358C|nr:hypothetical protein [Streptomyces sp. ME01-18a]MDX3433895.1 hypothetical protein [Streptomyces sp. ME01-18a]
MTVLLTEKDSELDRRILPKVIACACALAQAYFPVRAADGSAGTDLRRVGYLLTGQYDAWAEYPHLSGVEQRRISRMLRQRPNRLSNEESLRTDAERFLATGAICEYVLQDTGVLAARHGMLPTELADVLLEHVDRLRAENSRALPSAEPGDYVTTLRVPVAGHDSTFAVQAHYTLQERHAAPDAEPVTVHTAAAVGQLTLKVQEFLALNRDLDQQAGESFRSESLEPLFDQLRTGDDVGIGDLLQVAAGDLRVLQAPTGFGKSVLMRSLGSWAQEEGVTLGLAVPTTMAALKMAYGIEKDLRARGVEHPERLVVPLMSPNSMMSALDHVAAESRDRAFIKWAEERLGYGCALPSLANVDDEVDAWVPGHEACMALVPYRPVGAPEAGRGSQVRRQGPCACPFRAVCGKFRLARLACTAQIIVTTHANFYQGHLHIPVLVDSGAVVERMTVEELFARRCQLTALDEVDAFQSFVLGRAGRGLTLAWGNRQDQRPLLRIDGEFIQAFGRVRPALDESMRNTLMRTRWLAETYTSHLAYGALGPSDRKDTKKRSRKPQKSGRPAQERRWILPQRWDGWCSTQLRALFADDAEQVIGLERGFGPDVAERRLFAALYERKIKMSALPQHLHPLAELLRKVIDPDSDAGSLSHVRKQLEQLLAPWVPNQQVRADVLDRMLRRAFLEPLRLLLYRFVHNAQQLKLAGVESARDIADVLGPFSAWRAIPHGPQGRLMFAFTEDVRTGVPEDTRLSVAAFGGDPHTYVTTLGQITALAHSGHKRIVVGLSATAYAPGAHRHHVHTVPTWWVPDDVDHGVSIEAELFPGLASEMLRVSGVMGKDRVEATILLGRRMWPRLRGELQDLGRESKGRVQDSILLVTTSYASCQHLREGLMNAGAEPGLIAVAVRPRPDDGPAFRHDESGEPLWHEIPGDQLESFTGLPRARILIAPLGRAERGLNILAPQSNKSAIGSIWLAVRPVPLVDEPDELLAHVGARALDERETSSEPWGELKRRHEVAGHYFEKLVTSERYFRSLPLRAKRAIAAELIISLIQLVGRARRGGTPGRIKLVDAAFLDTSGNSDLPHLIRELREQWSVSDELPRMRRYYGTTLNAFFRFADRYAGETLR